MKGKLYKYLVPNPEVIGNDVYLAVLTTVGYMWSGKTVLSRKIAAKTEKYVRDYNWNFLYVEARRQSDVISYFEENKDVLKGLDYLMIVYDDAGRYYLSREGTTKERREELKDFLEIRHIFKKLGFSRGVLAINFNIQRYEMLDLTIRNSPVVILKTLVAHDRKKLRELAQWLGRRRFKFLRAITSVMYFNSKIKDPEVISIFKQLGVDVDRLDRNSVKRFAVVAYADGSRKITDFGEGVEEPRNKIVIETDVDGEEKWLPRDREELEKILFWMGLAVHIYKDDPILNALKTDDFLKILRMYGLRFRSEKFYKLKRLSVQEILSDPDVMDYLHRLDLI